MLIMQLFRAGFLSLHLVIESEMKKRKGKVVTSWRLDETYIKVNGIWCYLYRAVDKLGNTVDFLLTRRRERMSAQSFLIKASNNRFSLVLDFLQLESLYDLF